MKSLKKCGRNRQVVILTNQEGNWCKYLGYGLILYTDRLYTLFSKFSSNFQNILTFVTTLLRINKISKKYKFLAHFIHFLNIFRQVYQRGSQKEGSPHYVFLYSEDDQSEDEEHFPLKARNSTEPVPRKIQVINVQIQSEDTLQALALRYHCSVSRFIVLQKFTQIVDKANSF